MTPLETALVEITSFLKGKKIPYMVIGGIANIFWGIPRATVDIDITVMVPDENIENFVSQIRKKFRLLVSNPAAFIKKTRVLPIQTKMKHPIDLIFGQLPFEEEAIRRSLPEKIGNKSVRICSPEDLIIHKIISQRGQDLEDVKGIIQNQKRKLNRKYLDPIIKNLSKEMDRSDILDFYKNCLK